MNPVLFQVDGVVPTDYLPGLYQWAFPVQLTAATLSCQQPPSAGVLTLTLEVAGAAQTVQFSLAAGSSPVTTPQAMNVLVPANGLVRWQASFTGTPDQAAQKLSISLQMVPQSVAQVATLAPQLTLRYLNGSTRLTLFTYDPVANAYTEVSPGISTGLLTLTQTGNTQISFALPSGAQLVVANGKVAAPALIARGGVVSTFSPRVQFCVNGLPIAVLAQDGLRVVQLTEGTPVLPAAGSSAFNSQFQFWSQGALTALLGSTGMIGLSFQEA